MLFDACLRTLLAISTSIRRQMMHPRNFDTTKFVHKTLGKKQIHLKKINWNASGLQEKKLPHGKNDAEPYGVIVSFDDA